MFSFRRSKSAAAAEYSNIQPQGLRLLNDSPVLRKNSHFSASKLYSTENKHWFHEPSSTPMIAFAKLNLYPCVSISIQIRCISVSKNLFDEKADAKSKVEQYLESLKEEISRDAAASQRGEKWMVTSDKGEGKIVPRKSILTHVVEFCKHYYHGFRLLFIQTKIAIRQGWMVLRGYNLNRKERKQVKKV